jgi:hypothetical protein
MKDNTLIGGGYTAELQRLQVIYFIFTVHSLVMHLRCQGTLSCKKKESLPDEANPSTSTKSIVPGGGAGSLPAVYIKNAPGYKLVYRNTL